MEYVFNGKPLTKVTNKQEQQAFADQYINAFNNGENPPIIPYDASYMQKECLWVYSHASGNSYADKNSKIFANKIIVSTYKDATPEEQDTIMLSLLQHDRDYKTGYANRNLAQLAGNLYYETKDKTQFSYLTRCHMKINQDVNNVFSSVRIDDQVPQGSAGNLDKRTTETLFKNINFAEKTSFLQGLVLNKYGYITEEVLSNYLSSAERANNGGEQVAPLLPQLKGKIENFQYSSKNTFAHKIVAIARNMRNTQEQEDLFYGALALNIPLNDALDYSNRTQTSYKKAQEHHASDKSFERWKEYGVIDDFESILKYHQNEFSFSASVLSKINHNQRTKVYANFSGLSNKNKTELAHNILDDNLAGPDFIALIIQNENKVNIPTKRNLALTNKLGIKVEKIKQDVTKYEEEVKQNKALLDMERKTKKQKDVDNQTYRQQQELHSAAYKLKRLDDDKKPKYPSSMLETIITNAINGNAPSQLPEHNIGFLTFNKEAKRLQNAAIAAFNQEVAKVAKNPTELNKYSGRILEQSTAAELMKKANKSSDMHYTASNKAKFANDTINYINGQLPQLQSVIQSFDELRSTQQQHLEQAKNKAKARLKDKGIDVEEKFGGIEADKQAEKVIRQNKINARKQNIEKIKALKTNKSLAKMSEKANKSIDAMAERDAARLNEIIEKQNGVDVNKAKDGIVRKDKHVKNQNSDAYTQKVREKMQKKYI